LMAEPAFRRGPGPLVRALGRAVNSAVARFPWSWRLFRIDYRSVPQIPSDPLRLRCRSGSPAILTGH
jgi:hypothetical protein